MQKLLVWDALIAWRDEILQKDIRRKSKIDYFSNMAQLIENGILDLEKPLSEFKKSDVLDLLKKIDSISEWSDFTKESRKVILRSFHRFASNSRIKPSKVVIPFEEYRSLGNVAISELLISQSLSESLSSNEDKAKSQSLTDHQLEQFFNEIRTINERDFIICWTMWNLKCTIHQVLNFKVGDYDPFTGVFKISEDDYRLGEIRQELKELILKQCEEKKNEELIFTTEKGKKIHPGQIVRNMKTASKRAKLPIIISPKILYAHAIAYGKKAFSSMSEEEKAALSKEYAKQYKTINEKVKNVFAE